MPKGTEVQVGFFALQSKQTFPIRLIVLAQPISPMSSISPISLVCILSILSFFLSFPVYVRWREGFLEFLGFLP